MAAAAAERAARHATTPAAAKASAVRIESPFNAPGSDGAAIEAAMPTMYA